MENIHVIGTYLKSKNEYEVSYAKGLIKRGICFVIIETDKGLKFYPSRFVGYKNNSIDAHERNTSKDGRETNPAISSIIGVQPQYDKDLEDTYKKYCISLGFKSNKTGTFGVKQKYWKLQ